MEWSSESYRWLWAGAAMALFFLTCVLSFWPRRGSKQGARWLVIYASQTGQAEEIAKNSYQVLLASGLDVVLMSLQRVTPEILQKAKCILIVASTTGSADAPDEAQAFDRSLLRALPDLSHTRFAVLALGDKKYEHFCAFGQRLYHGFEAAGAQPLVSCIKVDDLDSGALSDWDELLLSLGAVNSGGAQREAGATFSKWKLVARECLNPMGERPLFRLNLLPEKGALPVWQAGDLVEVLTSDGHRRDYSLASLSSEKHVELYVRTLNKGKMSTLLNETLAMGEAIDLRVKSHRQFHAPEGAGPLLLIAVGSGLAGLRAHIFESQRPCWLIYGERHPQHDCALSEEAKSWPVKRLDLAFSRPIEGEGQYVQDIIKANAQAIANYLGGSGGVMLCGGLAMGREVELSLRMILGDNWVECALSSGRYRRDLY